MKIITPVALENSGNTARRSVGKMGGAFFLTSNKKPEKRMEILYLVNEKAGKHIRITGNDVVIIHEVVHPSITSLAQGSVTNYYITKVNNCDPWYIDSLKSAAENNVCSPAGFEARSHEIKFNALSL